jgi:hypothetical protein
MVMATISNIIITIHLKGRVLKSIEFEMKKKEKHIREYY